MKSPHRSRWSFLSSLVLFSFYSRNRQRNAHTHTHLKLLTPTMYNTCAHNKIKRAWAESKRVRSIKGFGNEKARTSKWKKSEMPKKRKGTRNNRGFNVISYILHVTFSLTSTMNNCTVTGPYGFFRWKRTVLFDRTVWKKKSYWDGFIFLIP